jgi:CHASE1-domain containing sensor protein
MKTHISENMKRLRRNRRLMVLVILAHIALGALLSLWVTSWVDTEMRNDLLRQTQLLAETIKADRLAALAGNEFDIEKPQYHRFKQQFASVRQINEQCRRVYLMGCNGDGKLFDIVDSQAVGSPQARLPGMTYDDAQQEFARIMETGIGIVAGPFRDSKGSFISGCVPVTGQAGEVIALLAMDFDAWDWKFGLAPSVLPLVVLTLMLFAILSVGGVLSFFRNKMPEELPRWLCYLELVLVVEVGLTLTIFAAWTAHLHEQHRQQGIFVQLAASRTLTISKTMRDLRDTELESLGRFYESQDRVTPDEFYRYSAFLTQSKVVQGWGWVPAVAEADKARFEKAARARGIKNFSIWQQDALGNNVPAVGRQIYYPVLLITPAALNNYAVGFDLGSEPLRRVAIDEALRSGLTTASDPITLIQDNAGYRALLVLRPVFDRERSGHLRGFVFAFLRVEKLLESAGPDTSTTQLAISLLHPDGSSEPLAGSDKPLCEAFSIVRPVLAFDKTFALTARASADFLRLHPARGGISFAVLGVLLTAALTAVFALMLRNRLMQEQTGTTRTFSDYIASAGPSVACRNRMPKRRRQPRRVRLSGYAARRA